MRNQSLKQRFRNRMFKLLTGYDVSEIVLKEPTVSHRIISPEAETIIKSEVPKDLLSKSREKTIKEIPMQGRNIDFSHLFKNKPTQDNKLSLYDINQIQSGLNADTEKFIKTLMGEPNLNMSNSNQLRYGTKGSLAITLKGAKTGLWYMHETGKGGNLLQLIQQQKQSTFQEALEYAANYLGITKDNANANKPYYQKVYGFSKPIKNTIGEKYLRNERGITAKLSDTIRFVPFLYEPVTKNKHPALVVFSKDMDGEIKGMQAIFLDRETGKKLDIDLAKRSYGEIKGTIVPINHGKDGLALCEGVETALSIASAKPNLTVFATLSSFTNFSSVNLQAKGSPIILCIDNDGTNTNTGKKVSRTINELSEKGFNVFATMPKESGYDFNDVLKNKGSHAVATYLDNAKLVKGAIPIKENINHLDVQDVRSKQAQKESSLEI